METALVRRIRRELERRGAWTVKIHGGPMQESGIPDIVGCYRGRFLGLEVKRPDGDRPSGLQRYMIEKVTTAGGFACAVRTVEEALAVLDKIDNEEARPVCAVAPMQTFEIAEARLDQSVKLVQSACKKLTRDQVLDVFFELGLSDGLIFEVGQPVVLRLTDMQLAAVSFALACVVENEGRKVENGSGMAWVQEP